MFSFHNHNSSFVVSPLLFASHTPRVSCFILIKTWLNLVFLFFSVRLQNGSPSFLKMFANGWNAGDLCLSVTVAKAAIPMTTIAAAIKRDATRRMDFFLLCRCCRRCFFVCSSSRRDWTVLDSFSTWDSHSFCPINKDTCRLSS